VSRLALPKCYVVWKLTIELSTISIGKYGAFQANQIIGRPYHLTFEILDKSSNEQFSQPGLRVVSAAELYADIEDEESATPTDAVDGITKTNDGVEYEVVGQDGKVVMRTNRQIIDDPSSQVMTMDQIEALKAGSTGSGKEIIAKLLESHSALDQKTAFALAKYTLRKTKKYLRRFTILPLDVPTLARWTLTEKEPLKIMGLREEILSLIGSWSNIHYTPSDPVQSADVSLANTGQGRWLVVDETAGLLVAYMAEKMGILYSPRNDIQGDRRGQNAVQHNRSPNGEHVQGEHPAQRPDPKDENGEFKEEQDVENGQEVETALKTPSTKRHKHTSPVSTSNTITLLHAAAQPNLSLLQYFHFDPFSPPPKHPLTHHLKTLSWLQLLHPEDDAGYEEPAIATPEMLSSWKSGKRSSYFRKRRRWERIKSTVDEARAGGFDGLIVASVMQPVTILRHAAPLLRGGAQVIVYAPTLEPLAELADYYSTARRKAFLNDSPEDTLASEDFPVNPTLLLAPTIQTARCRSWQVLPGRMHPMMTGKGGAEGYVFTATRVLPAEGKVEARGKGHKKRKVRGGSAQAPSQAETPEAVEKSSAVDIVEG